MMVIEHPDDVHFTLYSRSYNTYLFLEYQMNNDRGNMVDQQHSIKYTFGALDYVLDAASNYHFIYLITKPRDG